MTSRRSLTMAALLVAGAAGAGCSDEPSSTDYEDTAQALGALAASSSSGELHAFANVQLLSRGVMPAGFSLDASGQVQGAHLGLSYTFTLECRDAGGVVQAACGATTNSATANVAWAGQLDLPNLSASAERTGQLALSGLTAETAVLDGGGALTLEAEMQSWFQPRTTNLHLAITSDYDQLRFGTAPVRLIDGTVHYAVHLERRVTGNTTSSSSVSIDAVLTVTEAAAGLVGTLVLDGTQTFRVDLSTGRVTRT